MQRKTGTVIRARSADGREFRIIEEVAIISAPSLDNPRTELEGLRSLRTHDGHHVNRISDIEFEILGAGPLLEPIRAERISG
jgi:hypothetical protein